MLKAILVETATKLLTYEDSLAMPESTLVEIIEGELREMPVPSFSHQRILSRLADILRGQLDWRSVEIIQTYGQAIRFQPRFTYRIPDLGVFTRKNLVMNDAYYAITPPELLVEALSPSNWKGDLHELLSHYESILVPEVWLLDSDSRVLRRLLLEEGILRETDYVSNGAVSPILFPNVNVDPAELWAAC